MTIPERLREVALGVSLYGAPDKDLLYRRIDAIAAELDAAPAGSQAEPAGFVIIGDDGCVMSTMMRHPLPAPGRHDLWRAPVHANGPGSHGGRFPGLMEALEQRFPDPEPFSAKAYEGRFIEWLDGILHERAQPAACRDLQTQWGAIMQACIEAMPPGHMAQHAAAEHACGNPLPAAVAALTKRAADCQHRMLDAEEDNKHGAKSAALVGAMKERIARLDADLVEERSRIAAMRAEHGEEVAGLVLTMADQHERILRKTLEVSAEMDRVAELTAQARHADDCLEAAKARIAELEAELRVSKLRAKSAESLAGIVSHEPTPTDEDRARMGWADKTGGVA